MLNLVSRCLNLFKLLVVNSLLYRLFHATAPRLPLYCMEFLVKLVSSLGRMISPVLLFSPPEFLCTKKSLNSIVSVAFNAFENELRQSILTYFIQTVLSCAC